MSGLRFAPHRRAWSGDNSNQGVFLGSAASTRPWTQLRPRATPSPIRNRRTRILCPAGKAQPFPPPIEGRRNSTCWVWSYRESMLARESARGLQPLNGYGGHTAHQFIAQVMILLGFLAETRSVEENGVGRFHRP